MFVKVSRPTTHTGKKAGLYPDPLVPRDFGQHLPVPSCSSSLYVLFHVPYGTRGRHLLRHAAPGQRRRDRRPARLRARVVVRLAAPEHAHRVHDEHARPADQPPGQRPALVGQGPADGGHQLLPHDAAARPHAADAERACRRRARRRLVRREPVPGGHRALPGQRTVSTWPTPRCPGTTGSRTRPGARTRPARRSSPT